MQRLTPRWLRLFLACWLQLQALAALAMPCSHGDPTSAADSSMVCHGHEQTPDQPQTATLTCMQCLLGVCCGLYEQPPTTRLALDPVQSRAHLSARHPCYDSHVAERPVRPPIGPAV